MYEQPNQPPTPAAPEPPTKKDEAISGMALAIRLGTVREPGTRAAASPWPW